MAITWTITKNTATNTLWFESTRPCLVDLNQVVIGDCANIFGTCFNANNRGSFEIINVEVYYATQRFQVENKNGVGEVAVQISNDDLQFFRPTINTVQSGSRTVVVSSTIDRQLEVTIPATTQAVSRGLKTGSYVHSNSALTVKRINRDANGLVTVLYDGIANPTLSTGDFVSLDGVCGTPFRGFKSTVAATSYPAVAHSDASNQDSISILQTNTSDVGRKNFVALKASNGDVLSIGGSTLVASTPTATSNIGRYQTVSQATVSDGTLAEGSTRYSYQWAASGSDTLNTELLRASNILGGPDIGQVMITGGVNISLGNWSARQVGLDLNTYKYDPVANTTTAAGLAIGVGYSQTSLSDGRILLYGGAKGSGGTGLSGQNQAWGFLWNPGTEVWSVAPDVAGTFPRAHHTTTQLNDGTLLFAGGLAGATSHLVDTNTLAKWAMNETVGVTINDTSGNGYNLTESGVVAHVNGSQIANAREFTQASSAGGAGDAGAVTALLGDWTVEWWSCGASGAYPAAMVLSGLGSGTIVAYGGLASETEANNTIMHVSISGGNLVWRWEHGAGIDVTGSFAITGVVADTYNHYAVRKKYNGATYDVTLFVNGFAVGTSAGVVNASGGSTSQWYMAQDPDGAAGFSGVIDDVRISKVARTDEEILLDYWTSSSSIPSSVGSHRIGPLVHQCEAWDGSAGSTTVVGSLTLARAYHTATVLPNGNVIVIGGLAHDPVAFTQKLIFAGPTGLNGCSESTNVCEIYDVTAKRWYPGPILNIRRHKHTSIYVPSRNSIFVIGGESTQGDDCKNIEIVSLNNMSVTSFNEKLTYNVGDAVLLDNGNIICFTAQTNGASYINIHQMLVLSSQNASKNLNGVHKLTNVGAGYIQFQSDANSYYTNYGKPSELASMQIATASRTGGVTNIVFGASGHNFKVGDDVFVNFNQTLVYTSGVYTVTAADLASISYADAGGDVASGAEIGEVYKNYSPNATIASDSAISDAILGPYIFDPIEGLGVTNTQSTVGGSLYAGIHKNQKYTVLPVVDATVFPDSEGWIVIGFGTDYQTLPIKYYGRFDQFGLFIDYSYEFKTEEPVGTEVNLLSQRAPFAPTALVGGLYATSSSAGRIAAENTINDIAAAGIDLKISIVYPGDRGLGGEDYPASGATKLSDKTTVWAGDEIDAEIAALKGQV